MKPRQKRLLIVAHAPSDNTRCLLEAALRGARHPMVESVETLYRPPLEAQPEDVLACDAILLGTTENFGYMCGALKDFFDRIYYPCLERAEGLSYGLYIRAGLDGTGTERAVDKITLGLKWRRVQPCVLCRGQFCDEFIDQVETLGQSMAFGLDAAIY